MQKFLRYLRISFTAFCGTACVLLCLLWGRSKLWAPICVERVRSGVETRLAAANGVIVITRIDMRSIMLRSNMKYPDHPWKLSSHNPQSDFRYFQFIWKDVLLLQMQTPIWILLSLFITLAITPWIRWSNRFSLRTLLVAITLIAVVLGLIVWAVGGGK